MEKIVGLLELVGSRIKIRVILLSAIVIFSTSAKATEYLVAPQGVKVGEAWFPFGPERIDEAKKVWIGTVEQKGVECHATTRFAVRKNNSTIVLVETGRHKLSRSIGVLCFTSFNVESFGEPHRFIQTVLRINSNSTVEILASNRSQTCPKIKVKELRNENLLRENKQISKYLRSAIAAESPEVTYVATTVSVRQLSEREMAELPPLKSASTGD